MNDIDKQLLSKSRPMLERFCANLDKISPLGAAATVAAVIAPVVIYAGAAEIMHCQEILSAQGPEALKAFRDELPDTAMAYATRAMMGSLNLHWQNLKAFGIMAEATLPALAGIGVHLAQSFTNLKRQVADLKVQNSLLSAGKPLPPAQSDVNRPTGATRIQPSDALPPSQRFERSLDALNTKVAALQPEPVLERSKGPRL